MRASKMVRGMMSAAVLATVAISPIASAQGHEHSGGDRGSAGRTERASSGRGGYDAMRSAPQSRSYQPRSYQPQGNWQQPRTQSAPMVRNYGGDGNNNGAPSVNYNRYTPQYNQQYNQSRQGWQPNGMTSRYDQPRQDQRPAGDAPRQDRSRQIYRTDSRAAQGRDMRQDRREADRYRGDVRRDQPPRISSRDINRRYDWDRDWRRDQRYDWQRYRSNYRYVYRASPYYAPYGWDYGYRRFSIGFALWSGLYADQYWISDPYYYHLPPAYGSLRWVRYYDDALLVDIRTGYVVDVIYDFFW